MVAGFVTYHRETLVSPTAASPIPDGLEVVVDFVNTLDLETGADELSSPTALAKWLAERDLLRPRSAPADGEALADARELREGLRSLMLANNGGGDDRAGWAALERTARRGELAVHFGGAGMAALSPGADGVAGGLARLLVPVARAVGDGTWRRAKACRAEDCQYAFYDRSRNRAGVWCEMAVCGNRTKVRAYRSRSARSGSRSAGPAAGG